MILDEVLHQFHHNGDIWDIIGNILDHLLNWFGTSWYMTPAAWNIKRSVLSKIQWMALQSRGVNVKQYCPLLVVTFHFLLKNFFFNSSGLNSCSLLPDSRNDYKNMKTAVLHVSDVYVSVIGLYSRQGNYVIFAVYPALHILPAQKYKYKYRCQGNCVKCIKSGHFCK